MGLVRTILFGRPDGTRAKIRRMFLGGGPVDTSPGSAYSAPRDDDDAPPPAEAALGLQPEPPRGVTPPDGYEVVLHKDALKPGKVTEIIIGGTAIAVANGDGTFYACTNSCPHAGGPLGEGTLDGHELTCPYHGWSYDLAEGVCLTNGDVEFQTFDVQVVGDAVCVKL
jgi:nitrite reductase (NADH) small subunit/3-phenylpropionate/trans-cinnamate dioxygenase ferredoxin subunit